MLTEYGGAPVDGGTIPALIFNEVVGAYESLKSRRAPIPRAGAARRRRPRRRLSAPTTPSGTHGALHRPPPPASQSAPSGQPHRRRPAPAARGQSRRPRPAAARHRAAPPQPAGSRASRARRQAPRPRQVLALAAQKRHGSSVGSADPDPRTGFHRAPRATPRRGPGARTAARASGAPLSSSPIPSASVSLPGPEHSSRMALAAAPPAHLARCPSAARAPGSAPRRRRPRARRRSSDRRGSRTRGRRRLAPGGPNSGAVRAVSPTKAWQAGSSRS